jgi:opacity protein-like surface antigen
MKKLLVITTLIIISAGAWAQESMLTLSYGWASTNPEESDQTADGFRINALFDYNPNQGKLVHGMNLGYVLTKYEQTSQLGTNEYSFRSWPIYYSPKVLLGNSDRFKVFIKGALGLHMSKYSEEGPVLSFETNDTGFFGGVGAGALIFLKENIFLNVEYEWEYQSNISYGNAFLNTAQLGIGFKF